ncbi:hypothetical protein RHECNPAF_310014 [Rhizobium etli CNPAF512]|nr:hypothetical protein RHECNPAF_310014 [Rhizobium etli CNPAF512]
MTRQNTSELVFRHCDGGGIVDLDLPFVGLAPEGSPIAEPI